MPNSLTTSVRALLREQGLDFAGSDTDLTAALGRLDRKELLDLYPDFASEWNEIREANSPGTIGGIVNSAKTAFDRSVQAKNVIGGVDDTDAQDIAERERAIRERKSAPAWEDWQRTEGKEAAKVFLRDPIEILSNIVVSGFAGSLPAIAGGVSGGAAGAAAGSAVPGVGNLVGGTVGAALGTGAGSLAVEYGSKYLDVLREAGADLADPESIVRVVSNPETRARAQEMGLRRGIPVAVFDAASAGLAGKLLKGVRTATTAQNVRRGLGEAAIQGGLGGAGEIAGALSAGEKISPGAVFEEVVGELGPGAAEVASAAARRQMAEAPPVPMPAKGIPPRTNPSNTLSEPVIPQPEAPLTAEPTPAVPVARRVALMTEEQQAARLADLTAREAALAADEQQELLLLRQILGQPETISPRPITDVSGGVETAPPAAPATPVFSPVALSPTGGQPTDMAVVSGESAANPVVPGVVPAATQAEANAALLAELAQVEGSTPVVDAAQIPAALIAEPIALPASAPAAGADVITPNAEAGAASLPTSVLTPEPTTTPSGNITGAMPDLGGGSQAPVPVAPQPSPTLEQRLAKELKAPKGFVFGAIQNEGSATVDLRSDPRFETLTPEQAANLPVEGAIGHDGNKSKTRVAVVLESPDGRYVQTGLLVPQEVAGVGTGAKTRGPAVQTMAVERRPGGGYTKAIKEGGNRPALLSDVIAAGYRLRAIVQFAGEPGNIFQRWANREAYDAAYAATAKDTGSAAAKTAPTLSAAEGVQRKAVVTKRAALERKVDALAGELETADPARAAEINEEIQGLYRELGTLPEVGLSRGDSNADANWGLMFTEPAPNDYSAADLADLRNFEANYNEHYRAPNEAPIAVAARTPRPVQGDVSRQVGAGSENAATQPGSGGQPSVLRSAFERLFGRRVIFFESRAGSAPAAAGARRGRPVIFFNTKSANGLAGLLGHEWVHTIEQRNPAIYGRLRETVLFLAPVPDGYRNARAAEGYPSDQIEYEWVADVAGERFHEPEFWREMQRVAEQRGQASAFADMVRTALEWLDALTAKVRAVLAPEAQAPALRHIAALRRVIAEAASDVVQAQGGAKPAAEALAPEVADTLPSQAAVASRFSLVAARLRQRGARVDVFARTFMQAQLAQHYAEVLAQLNTRLAAAPEGQRAGIEQQIAQVERYASGIERIRAVTYSPAHISMGLADVENANLADLVTLIHEAGHSLLGQQTPELQAQVLRAVQKVSLDLHGENRTRRERTGRAEANLGDPEELLVDTLGQRLAEEGVPDAPSLARVIVQWVKDLYFRLAMAVQAAFGREPSPQLALSWFENQLRRVVGGDFDYRFADIFKRFGPEAIGVQVARIVPSGGTPANLTNYYDPLKNATRQPQALPTDSQAIAWTLKFAEDAPVNPGEELEIPHKEAMARIMGAALNEVEELAAELHKTAAETRPGLTFDQWWTAVGAGETPKARLATLAQQVPGSEGARIGGERMTDNMNTRALVETKALLYLMENTARQRAAQSGEKTALAERKLVGEAKRKAKLEGDLRNAALHEATFRDQLKDQIRELSQGHKRGVDAAHRAGELAQAVRDAEGLTEDQPLPEEYQTLFKRVLADDVPLFDYVDAIAKLDLPLTDLTAPEFYAAIEANAASDDTLGRLMEPRNRPLLVALRVLTRRNADQVDMLLLRRAEAAKFLAVHGELKAIREASDARLKELAATIRSDRKATTFADRLKRAYIESRTKLRAYQTTIQEAEGRQSLIAGARQALAAKVAEIETGGLAAPSEWKPREGATYLAMSQNEAGAWRSRERTLNFTREGPPVSPGQLRSDLAANWAYLKANADKAGSKTYELVRRQTEELSAIDVQRKYPEVRRLFLEKLLLPSADLILSGGGAGAARAAQMLKKFQFIMFSNWDNVIFQPALEWANRLRTVTKAAGMTDQQQFLDQIYDPVLYYLQTEPGLEEGPALREALRAARRRLTGLEPQENFDVVFRDFLTRTKALSESFVEIAEKSGVFVADPRLGGELRRAVSRGWLTVMRRMNAATVSTILTEMDGAGWKLEFENAGGVRAEDSFEKGVASGKKVVRSTTFDALMPWKQADEARAQAATAVLDDPQRFAQAISGFFTPGIIERWLAPFINKPGDSLFTDPQGEKIDQLDVQSAWQAAGGDVAAWIDGLGQKVGLSVPEGDAAEAGLSPEGEWRASMLSQISTLYQMESRIAADSNQVSNLFDPTGRPAHLLMDARENDLLPPEHVQHMGFDPQSARNMLATLAFHAAFGRNGADMVQALADIKGGLSAKVAAFRQLRGATEGARKDYAKRAGLDYADLKNAAKVLNQVEEGQLTLEAAFGFGNEAGVLGDARTGLQLLHFVAQQTTNNPKTGLLNLLQIGQRAIARRTLDPVMLRDTTRAGGELVKQFFGQSLEAFGLHLLRASQHARDVGAVQGQGIGQLPWTEVLGIASAKRGEEQPTAIKVMRTVGGLQRKGARVGFGESREFPRMANVPFLSNTMQGIGLAAAISNGTAEATSVESLVKAAMDYFAANPEDAANPNFQLSAKDLRAVSSAWFSSPGSLEYFRRSLVDYGVGNLEDVARDAMERATRGEPILTRDQVLKAAMMANNELDLQGSINTNPGVFVSNPIMKFATPLLGWPIRQMNQIHGALRDADGRASARAFLKAVGILAVWSLPMGLAFTFLTDEYDERVLKKKTNLGSISDKNTALQNSTAILQRLSRAGNIYGIGMDAFSTALAGMDPTSGQRPFSLDSRILAFSQLRSIADAVAQWINSDFATTYAGFERPLFQAMGGAGAIHAVDIFNAALGLDNQESRLTQRTNVQQWLRAAGREAGLELRRSGGASATTSPVGTWTREMMLAAMGNDRLAFLDAYRRAVDAAREEGAPDPEAKVLESWRNRSPLEVFRTKPTEFELQRTLAAMSDSGKEAVTSALRLYDQFSAMIAPTKAERYQQRQAGQLQRGMSSGLNIEALRRSMAGGALGVR